MLLPEIGPDCPKCPRLCAFRSANRQAFPHYHNAPVAGFGPVQARLAIIGLAPGLHGANCTGRPFTGDYAGDLLYASLGRFAMLSGSYNRAGGDDMQLVDCRIVNAVRCVPPQNKPLGDEINNCREYLAQELSAMANLRVILALGGIAHRTILRMLRLKATSYPFTHGQNWSIEAADHWPGQRRLMLYSSYHCSRYNVNTKRLSAAM
ncbi:MAG: uracil-DNA glycosylase, partial [Pseudomonadota bacterium]